MPTSGTEPNQSKTDPLKGSFFTKDSKIILQDGLELEGNAFGDTSAIADGEFVFHTGMSGYQEVLTDPSYAGQIVVFTYPHIGNYGVNEEDNESKKMYVRGVVVRDYVESFSSWRATQSLGDKLKDAGIFGISGVDTRRLTRHLRKTGSVPGAMGIYSSELVIAANEARTTDGMDLAKEVSTKTTYNFGIGKYTVVAMDFGIKKNIVEQLGEFAKVIVVPASTPADEILSHKPDGVFLSNGPGDPSAVGYASDTAQQLLGRVPIFGICLGHQLLSTALGGTTKKLKFGHHGANHPIKDLATDKVEITSQNHSYEVVADSIKDAEITHVNLNDGVCEGIKSTKYPAFSVQYHPEAAPGPHESKYLFDRFKELMDA